MTILRRWRGGLETRDVPRRTPRRSCAQNAGEVVGAAAGDEALVGDDLLVDDVGAGVAQVGADARERRELPAATRRRPRRASTARGRSRRSACRCRRSRARSATASSSMRSWSGLTVPPGQQQRVVVVDRRRRTTRPSTVNVPASSRSLLRAAISPSWIDSSSTCAPASVTALARLLELDALDAVGGQDRHLLALQLTGHGPPPFVVGLRPVRGPQRSNSVSGRGCRRHGACAGLDVGHAPQGLVGPMPLARQSVRRGRATTGLSASSPPARSARLCRHVSERAASSAAWCHDGRAGLGCQ